MHTRGTPSEWRSLPPLDPEEIVPVVLTSLEASVVQAEAAGVLRKRIVVDPGLGFGKRLDENYPILANLTALHRLKLPIMIGASRKNFLANTLAQAPKLAASSNGELPPVNARIHATMAANVAAILSGVHILRVHDVQPACESAAIADQILLSTISPAQGCE